MNRLAEASLCVAGMLDVVVVVVAVVIKKQEVPEEVIGSTSKRVRKVEEMSRGKLCFLCAFADRRNQEFGIMGVEYRSNIHLSDSLYTIHKPSYPSPPQ